MNFVPDKVDDFLQLFERVKHKVRHFEGCLHLELMKDTKDPYIFSTFSIWLSEEHLENYRNSNLFKEVWAENKTYFAEKPAAFSLIKYLEVN